MDIVLEKTTKWDRSICKESKPEYIRYYTWVDNSYLTFMESILMNLIPRYER